MHRFFFLHRKTRISFLCIKKKYIYLTIRVTAALNYELKNKRTVNYWEKKLFILFIINIVDWSDEALEPRQLQWDPVKLIESKDTILLWRFSIWYFLSWSCRTHAFKRPRAIHVNVFFGPIAQLVKPRGGQPCRFQANVSVHLGLCRFMGPFSLFGSDGNIFPTRFSGRMEIFRNGILQAAFRVTKENGKIGKFSLNFYT